ncbi:MAG: helix-turn-helix domain-containing protein [Hydrogenophaga sp.]|uniref:helix-turn-helix domain-containing protein n=1 Tax=Hydrogenophaga sp. TaxID=1904254 RepID=UPI0016A19D94|nr:helix-turn-helix transcriptional regulator [Hydrogenophaga sp.]NIM40287.1 helix-turn-helix domain-containing protein [Hydrogenophaga sp.]NIN25518.1 helix-turn-helix domain-containing protein [Hydrogenophaga sp.]NIN30170.1 helix-turn-helix domain-containing protein [Hydrogenophaga sp.]NIN54471.1 helix-turn-helix domain-containing protein [Hydrogenophaga sp.]NIO50344.1 helix-turn-helix domain-containing protein [Hydrogenophaga sp.]
MTPYAYSTPDPLQTLPDVGRRFQVMRKAAGKTQTELANAVGMRQEALSRFESGSAADFSLAKLLRLLQALELQLEFKPVVRRPTLDEVLHEVREGRNTGPDAQ